MQMGSTTELMRVFSSGCQDLGLFERMHARLRLCHADGQPRKAHARVELDLLLRLRQVLHAARLVRLLCDDLDLLLRALAGPHR